ncbi:MAG: hypothetical protein KDB24_17025, partial [Microthrixaceae bacterium]|nr:hypothetical protein [Microthrixaceae bacterium]
MAVLDRPDPVTSGTTVRLVRKCAVDEGTDEPGVRSGPTAEGVRREIGTLARCTSTGVAVLVAHGERPVPWLETEDAGVHTLESPPDSPGRRIGVLAALTHVLAGLHRDGWAHLGLEPGHVIWRDRAPGGRPPPGESAPPEVTLCSLGSA